jgi:hypothetical protein
MQGLGGGGSSSSTGRRRIGHRRSRPAVGRGVGAMIPGRITNLVVVGVYGPNKRLGVGVRAVGATTLGGLATRMGFPPGRPEKPDK